MMNASLGFLILLLASAPNLFASNIDTTLAAVAEARQQGRLEQALAKLQELKPQLGPLYQLNHLNYLEGVLLSESGRGTEAMLALAALPTDFPFPDWVSFYRARSSVGLGSAGSSRLEHFLTRYTYHPKWAETVLDYAEALEAAGNYKSAKRWFDKLWAARRGSVSRRAALGHALLHLKESQPTEAVKDLTRLLRKSERDDVALNAVKTLQKLKPMSRFGEADLRLQARVWIGNRLTREARVVLRRLIERFPASLSRDQYAYLWGRSFVIEGDLTRAVEAYLEAYRKFPRTAWGIYCKYLAANTSIRNWDFPQAARHYREFIQAHPANRRVTDAYYHWADTYRWLGQPRQAEATAQRGLQVSLGSKKRRFYYYLARLYIELGRPRKALIQIGRLDTLTSRQLPSGVTREEIWYWKGVCLQQTGQLQTARQAFQRAAGGNPNYFAYLAAAKYSNETKHSAAPWSRELEQSRSWWENAGQRQTALSGGPRQRIRELLFLGLYDQAAQQIQRTHSREWGGPQQRLFNLAHYSALGGLARESLLAAGRLRRSLGKRSLVWAYPEPVARLLYPRHYGRYVDREALALKLDPELMLSVIHQESRFQANAKSPAAARGLMQFTLDTASSLAPSLQLESVEADDLYDPALSIRLGSHHLSQLLEEFDGSLERALAGYNGGSSNARRWSNKISTSDPALFVANIGFRETKLYVLKVMGNYFAYRQLYGSSSSNRPAPEMATPNPAVAENGRPLVDIPPNS